MPGTRKRTSSTPRAWGSRSTSSNASAPGKEPVMRYATLVTLIACISAASPSAAAGPQVIDVWPDVPPDETGQIGIERMRMSPKLDRTQVEVTEPTRLLTDVTQPTLTIYSPAKNDTGAAVLICPGGGYWNLYWQLEG